MTSQSQPDIRYADLEYMNDGPLGVHLREFGVADKLSRLIDAVRAIGEAHNAGVYHLDIHEGNTILDTKKGTKVGDFAVSAILDNENKSAQGYGFVSRRPVRYPAPKQNGSGKVSDKTDVYQIERTMLKVKTEAEYILPSKGNHSKLLQIVDGEQTQYLLSADKVLTSDRRVCIWDVSRSEKPLVVMTTPFSFGDISEFGVIPNG